MDMEDKKLNDDDLLNYLEGSMEGPSRRAFERKAYTSDELHDIYLMRKSALDAHDSLADELLGRDLYRDITSSENMRKVFQEAKHLRADKPSEMSIEDYLIDLIQEKLQVSRTESERIYEKIVDGIDLFYSSFDRQAAQDGASYLPTIEAAMDDLPLPEKVKYLSNVFILLLIFNGKIEDASIDSVKKQIEKFCNETENASELIEGLLARINNELLDADFPRDILSKENLLRLHDDFTIESLIDSWNTNREFAVYSAVCAYIAQSNGEIQMTDLSTDGGIDPVAIGMGVASGVKQAELTQQYFTGEIDENQFLHYLKIAACVVVFALVAYLAIHAAIPVSETVLQYLALDPTAGFWWSVLDIAMLAMFFTSLTLNVLLQGAFMAIVFGLIIEVIGDWVSANKPTSIQVATNDVAIEEKNNPQPQTPNGPIITPNGPVIDL